MGWKVVFPKPLINLITQACPPLIKLFPELISIGRQMVKLFEKPGPGYFIKNKKKSGRYTFHVDVLPRYVGRLRQKKASPNPFGNN